MVSKNSLGVFVAKGDVGIGTIVGSAVFNILVIIGLCALLCDKVRFKKNWISERLKTFLAYAIELVAIAQGLVILFDLYRHFNCGHDRFRSILVWSSYYADILHWIYYDYEVSS